MVTPAKRFQGWIDSLAEAWKDRLRGWMSHWVKEGAERLFDDFEPELRDEIRPSLERLKKIEGLPDDIKAILDKATEATSFIQFAAILPYLIAVMIGFAMGSIAPASRIGSYQIDKLIKSYRLDPGTLTRIWLRNKPKYEKLFGDLTDQGYDDIRTEVVKELSKIIPPLADMVRFADFSAFDPEVIEKWREFYDAPDWITDPMSLIGIFNEPPRDWANKYWFSHWIQPGRFELGEIYRRGLLGKPLLGQEEIGLPKEEGEAEALIKLAYRTMGYSSFWQDNLLQLVREVPTRVDVRRFWDMRTIDEAELRSIYQRRGYFGKDLENYILWTKVYVAFPDLIARWKNGWITEDDVRSELTALGMPAERVEEMIQTKIKPTQPERVIDEKELTKAEIYAGVKKEVISWDEGLDLLEDLGYAREEAQFILEVRVGVAAGSPETYPEFKAWTQGWRRAAGMVAKDVSEEIKLAARVLVRLNNEVKALEGAIAEGEAKLIIGPEGPAEEPRELKKLRASLHHAQAELSAAQTHYNILLAEFRHKEV